MTKRLILILVALAVIPIVILLVGLTLWTTMWSTSSTSGGTGGAPIPATSVPMPSTPSTMMPQPTVTAIPIENNPEHLKLPPDAKLQTVDQAVDLARLWARQDSSTEPRLVFVQLDTLKIALDSHEIQADPHPSTPAQGHSGDEGRRPVWRIVFAGTFFIPSCPAPVNSATPDNCGVTSSVRYVIDAVIALDYSKTYGAIAIPSATP